MLSTKSLDSSYVPSLALFPLQSPPSPSLQYGSRHIFQRSCLYKLRSMRVSSSSSWSWSSSQPPSPPRSSRPPTFESLAAVPAARLSAIC
ncbi:hypothetical protein RB195_012744 [Necator americanus]|uniref:Uncharacterized protein n=1 Tax=Necator americanus TaxID=51031 RepID=A0ABR1DSC3_NECAM